MNTRDLARIALLAALTAALGLVPPVLIPAIGVPITAQTLGVMLSGAVLGPLRGAAAQALLLLLVAAGFPLLAGGNGGLGSFVAPSAGFLLAWPLSAFVTGWLVRRFRRPGFAPTFAANVLGGIVVMYAVGVPWVALTVGVDLGTALIGSAVFIPGDLLKAGVAAAAAVSLRRSLALQV
jgi:biotin transport system substrate-specific component